ncbi:MAG: murein hydrolase activator EnvC family protein, partial [Hyphococcus sp.]
AKTKSMFAWPVRGAVIAEYGSGDVGRRNDGVNIAAPAGTPVRAAADGEVVYRGSELDGFGNLLLVKHTDGFVTAYAHNDAMLVKKGDKVRQGQVIAKVGESGAVTSPQLHFEIRQNLKSVDPIALLGAQ